jgi:hypothetical protein
MGLSHFEVDYDPTLRSSSNSWVIPPPVFSHRRLDGARPTLKVFNTAMSALQRPGHLGVTFEDCWGLGTSWLAN